MLFKNINNIIDKNEKKFFIEKINIINEMVKKYALKESINFDSIEVNKEIVFKELQKIGFVESKNDLELAKKILGKEYTLLFQSLTLYKKESWNFLNKFYNSYRAKAQAKNKKANKPKIIDLVWDLLMRAIK